jgi:hypothetical protein
MARSLAQRIGVSFEAECQRLGKVPSRRLRIDENERRWEPYASS